VKGRVRLRREGIWEYEKVRPISRAEINTTTGSAETGHAFSMGKKSGKRATMKSFINML
jgi:hypothetical protein